MAFLRGLVLVGLVLGGLVAQDDLAARAERVLQEAGCQSSLPGEAAPVRGRDRGDREARGERSGAPGRRSQSGWSGLPLSPVMAQILLWTAIVLAVVFLVASVVRGVGGRRAALPGKPKGAPVPRVVDDAPVPALAVPDHERLAAAGDFAAAVRALLQAAFALWAGRGGALPPAATGREVLRLVRHRRIAAEPLAQLVAAVERVHFGGRGADRTLYDASCAWLGQWEERCRSPK